MGLSQSLPRRAAICLAVGLAAAFVQAAAAEEAFPGGRPVNLIVPFPPGGGVDIVVRGVAERLSRELGVPVIVENKPGGSTVLATNYVSRATADGHTLLVATPALSINAALLPDRPPGDPRKILAPVARLANLPYLLTIAPDMPVNSVPELIAWAKAHPGQLTLANTGPLTAPRMAAELFGSMSGTKIVSVPFRGGGPQEIEITSGRVNGAFSQMSESLTMMQSGAKAIAVSTAQRTPVLPDVPSLSEFLPGFDVGSWNGVFAPAGTPPPIVDRLNQALNVALRDPALRERYGKLGYDLVGGTPAELAAYLDTEIAKWSALRQVVQLPTN